ncbi:hypothetical protein HanPI659440_Chr05g0186531 [Helianthus annuus]|nr:hypothetical protein HanPI659440_Chr05g0186531 [Helianthus annuus]
MIWVLINVLVIKSRLCVYLLKSGGVLFDPVSSWSLFMLFSNDSTISFVRVSKHFLFDIFSLIRLFAKTVLIEITLCCKTLCHIYLVSVVLQIFLLMVWECFMLFFGSFRCEIRTSWVSWSSRRRSVVCWF